ncbi:hypothetical protein CDL12_11132 [Handroanthus impetiginosus]|uniref:Uncharacterized protein n=1 Tax=Handroanthus impetiginosus TaxID=429701 RepID=A0A2G9HFB4_9LAMI|nr:hypothetical protein CDL12_11132 [Handroanthus impetiginosus]
MYQLHFYIAISFPISLHSHATSVPLFNGLNFSGWCEQVQFHLGVLDLDILLQVEKPTVITDKSSAEEKAFHKLWEKSNKLKHSQTADKTFASKLMSTLTNMKFDRSCTMHEHVLEMTNLAARLKTFIMVVDEFFLV